MLSKRIQCWALILSANDYPIQYKPGSQMDNADALSRSPLPDTINYASTPGNLVLLFNHLELQIALAKNIKSWTDKTLYYQEFED